MKHATHIFRLAAVLVLIGAGFFTVRSFMVPEGFGIHGSYTYGYFRADSEREQSEPAAVYQGSDKCRGCHEEQFTQWSGGEHAQVTCETCHGNWQAHNNNTKEKAGRDRSNEGCLICHARVEGRPAVISQVPALAQHVQEKGRELQDGQLCVSCHNGHDPKQ
jgi:hypothetical protein